MRAASRWLLRAAAVAVLAGTAAGAEPKPKPDVGADDVAFSDTRRRPRVEVGTAAGLVPAVGEEPGLCVMETGGTLLVRSFSAAGAIGDLVRPELPPLAAGESALASDSVLVRLKSGELLLMRQTQGTAEVTAPAAAASAFSRWRDFVGGRRPVQSLWRSSERGKTWTRLANLDSAVVLDGACGWPQEVEGKPAPAGWHRPEAYVDPWTGTVFLTIGSRAGTATRFQERRFENALLFVSRDEGATWTGSVRLPRWEPLAMTSSRDGRLWLVHAMGTDDTSLTCRLYWLEPPWTAVAGQADVLYGDARKAESRCNQVPADGLSPRLGQPNFVSPSLSRVSGRKGEHVVRLAFPALADGRQVERVVVVRVDARGKAAAEPGPTMTAADPKGSVLQATFVETDRADPGLKDDCDVALLSWIETAPARGEVVTRGALVTGASNWSLPFDVSRSQGARRGWKTNGEWLGDYAKGAVAFDGKSLRFAVPWSEPNAPEIDLHANVVTYGVR